MERGKKDTLPLIGKAVANWINDLSPSGAAPDSSDLKKVSYPNTDPELIHHTELMLAASLLAGMDHASRGHRVTLSDNADYHPLPFDEAINFLKTRVSMTKAEWQALEPKLAFRSFTMAKLTQCDYIESVRGRLANSLEKGEGFEKAWADVKAIAEADGKTIKPGYWETVYRTNVQTAYNAGRRMQFDRDPPAAVALMVLEDERTSDICRPLAGLVLPYNHPFWDDHWPPFHFNCRTTVRGIYDDEVGRIPSENVSMKKLRKMFHPQSGFGQNPIKTGTFYELTDEMAKRALHYGIMKDLKTFADQAGFKSVRLYNPDSLEGFKEIRVYENGGKIYKHASYGRKQLPEERVAEDLAESGKTVKLLPRSNILLSPDLWIDGEIWEVKNAKGTENSIKEAFRKKQADKIILVVPQTSFDTALTAAHQKVNAGFFQKVLILAGKIQRLVSK